MTRTTPLRLITLQLRQIFLTDAITFIIHPVGLRTDHLARNTMRARDRS